MSISTERSRAAHARASALIPGGVNSPVRAFKAVGGDPVVIDRAEGPALIDVDGNRYIDYVGSWGPMLHGHAHPAVVEAVREAAGRGTSYGAPCEAETELAQVVVDAVPSIDKVRFVNSGTEATMSAIRLARGFTGRDVVVKFSGCYHGHGDCLLADAGSGVATLGTPACAGVPANVVADTWTATFNDPGVADLLERGKDQIAAVIVEPMAGNMGVISAADGWLELLREKTAEIGALLIFDEVMTGFRVARGGVQELTGVTPDLTTLGKVIGGGLPVGAYGGRADVMDAIAPLGPVYQAGTLSGNPLAMAAGLATLGLIDDQTYPRLQALGDRLAAGLQAAADGAGVEVSFDGTGSMRGMFFHPGPVTDYEGAKAADQEAFARYFQGMLRRGVYLACSQYEAAFISTAHDEALIDRTIEAAREALAEVAAARATGETR